MAEPTEQRDFGVRLQKGSRNRQGAAQAELLPSHVSQQGNRSSPASQAEPVADGSDTERERRAEGQKQPRWEQRGSQPSSFVLGQAGGQPGGGDQGDIPRQWEAREKSFSPCKGGTNAQNGNKEINGQLEGAGTKVGPKEALVEGGLFLTDGLNLNARGNSLLGWKLLL